MAERADKTGDTQKSLLLRRIESMRRDRTFRAPFVNEVYRLGMPQRGRVNLDKISPINEEDLQDILDHTLAETIDDFSSDMMATFTPPHEPWVKHTPSKKLTSAQQKQISDQMTVWIDWFWDDIEESSFYDAADECYHELSAGTMALLRKDYGPLQPICYEAIPIRSLLIDKAPDGSCDGRFTEGAVTKAHFMVNYGPWIDMRSAPASVREKVTNSRDDQKFNLRDGFHRIYDKPGMVQWRRVVMIDNEIVYTKNFDEDGAESLYVARWRTESTSAYGVGPAWWATAPARVLVELHALVLGQMHKVVDPPMAYSDPDGAANLEQGIGAGDYLELGQGFDVKKLAGEGEFQAAFYSAEDLRMQIKRALYQDKPEQRGDTPPTATQWADETARAQQRFEIPRGKIQREFVLPVVRGHQWLRAKHGQMPSIMLGTNAILLKPQSPQAKARAYEKVSKAERLLMVAQSPVLAQGSQLAVDTRGTLTNIKGELGDELVVLRTDQQIQQITEQMAAAVQASGAGQDQQEQQQGQI